MIKVKIFILDKQYAHHGMEWYLDMDQIQLRDNPDDQTWLVLYDLEVDEITELSKGRHVREFCNIVVALPSEYSSDIENLPNFP